MTVARHEKTGSMAERSAGVIHRVAKTHAATAMGMALAAKRMRRPKSGLHMQGQNVPNAAMTTPKDAVTIVSSGAATTAQ